MKSNEYTLKGTEKKARKQMSNLLQLACKFKSSITFENDVKKFNGKSIIRINEFQKGEKFHIIAEGEDEKEALLVFDEFFAEEL